MMFFYRFDEIDAKYIKFFDAHEFKSFCNHKSCLDVMLKLNVDCRELNGVLARLAKEKLQTFERELILCENNNIQSERETVAVLEKELKQSI